MWSSLSVGSSYYQLDVGDDLTSLVASALTAHPLLKHQPIDAITIAKQTLPQPEPELFVENYDFPANGDSWFISHFGKGAEEVVKNFKRARRHMKDMKGDIDKAIGSVRELKSKEVQKTLDAVPWANDHHDTIRNLGLSDRNLKSLRLFGKSRESTLHRACMLWESADDALKMLDEFEDVWGEEEQNAWVTAMEQRQDAKKMWRSGLHQIDTLTKEQKGWLEMAKQELLEKGHMRARDITSNMIEKGQNRLDSNRMSKLLSMYGEEVDIIKAPRRGEYVVLSTDGIIVKDPWAYAAGFFDADGSIFITKRGEVRASAVATGDRGRYHCERLQKTLGCGTLSLDELVGKHSKRKVHRLNFQSKSDVRKVLNGVLPHLQLKELQAKAALRCLDEDSSIHKEQLRLFVQHENWKDDPERLDKKMGDWTIDKETVMSWKEVL